MLKRCPFTVGAENDAAGAAKELQKRCIMFKMFAQLKKIKAYSYTLVNSIKVLLF